MIIGQLRVHHVDGCEHALLAHWHGFVVEAGLTVPSINTALAHVIAHLHKIRLHGRNVVKFLKLDAIVDDWRLQQRVTL